MEPGGTAILDNLCDAYMTWGLAPTTHAHYTHASTTIHTATATYSHGATAFQCCGNG